MLRRRRYILLALQDTHTHTSRVAFRDANSVFLKDRDLIRKTVCAARAMRHVTLSRVNPRAFVTCVCVC
jgi:hypothetical protein